MAIDLNVGSAPNEAVLNDTRDSQQTCTVIHSQQSQSRYIQGMVNTYCVCGNENLFNDELIIQTIQV